MRRIARCLHLYGGWWLLLTGILFAVFWVAPLVGERKRPHPYQGVAVKIGSFWDKELIGQRVSLPEKDSQGFFIPRGKSCLLVSLSCTTCSSPDQLRTKFLSASGFPLVIVIPAVTPSLRKAFGDDPDHFLLVESSDGQVVPSSMLRNAPQCALVNAIGEIVLVPELHEEMSQFLARPHKAAES